MKLLLHPLVLRILRWSITRCLEFIDTLTKRAGDPSLDLGFLALTPNNLAHQFKVLLGLVDVDNGRLKLLFGRDERTTVWMVLRSMQAL